MNEPAERPPDDRAFAAVGVAVNAVRMVDAPDDATPTDTGVATNAVMDVD